MGGFVTFHFLTGKDRAAIAKDLAAAFKLTEPQAAKILRRITGRVRLDARVFELVPAMQAATLRRIGCEIRGNRHATSPRGQPFLSIPIALKFIVPGGGFGILSGDPWSENPLSLN